VGNGGAARYRVSEDDRFFAFRPGAVRSVSRVASRWLARGSTTDDDRSRSLAPVFFLLYFFLEIFPLFLDRFTSHVLLLPFSHSRFLVSEGRSQPKERSLVRSLALPESLSPHHTPQDP
jgi:hypothetical protein